MLPTLEPDGSRTEEKINPCDFVDVNERVFEKGHKKMAKLYDTNKKCLCCGREYPLYTHNTHCTCGHFLYVVGSLYSPRIAPAQPSKKI